LLKIADITLRHFANFDGASFEFQFQKVHLSGERFDIVEDL
jgi:hypothetical protein